MKPLSVCFALLTVSMYGCAYVKTDVQAVDFSGALAGERTYALVQAPSQEPDASEQRNEVVVRTELEKYGFVTAPVDRARYLLSISFGTRLATIGTYSGDCKPDSNGCQSDAALPSFNLFGGSQYRHSMTMRFFDRKSGEEAYKVSATNLDKNADPVHATDSLVLSAFARFARSGEHEWQVKLHADGSGRAPSVVSVTPRDH